MPFVRACAAAIPRGAFLRAAFSQVKSKAHAAVLLQWIALFKRTAWR